MKTMHEWNELHRGLDPITSRTIHYLTRADGWNNTCGYHIHTAFSASGHEVFIRSCRESFTAISLVDIETGHARTFSTGNELAQAGFSAVRGTNAVAIATGSILKIVDSSNGDTLAQWDTFQPGTRICQPMSDLSGMMLYFTTRKPCAGSDQSTEAYLQHYGGIPTTFCRVAIQGGPIEELWHHPQFACNHLQPHPSKPEIWLIDLDRPPGFSIYGDHGESPRAALWNIHDNQIQYLSPRNANRFQIHTNWSQDGNYIYYHGRDRETGAPIRTNAGGHYIGAMNLYGQVVWERVFPHFYYGHVSSHAQRNSLLIDSLITPDLIIELDFLKAGERGIPAMNILARHGSQVGYGVQETHPHGQISPDGKWLLYNQSPDGSTSRVCAVQLE